MIAANVRPTWRCGHPRTPENTIYRDGDRCRKCRLEVEQKASAKYRARKRAAAAGGQGISS